MTSPNPPDAITLTGGAPPADRLAKTYPLVGRLRLYRLVEVGRFTCARCAQTKTARLVAVHDAARLVCNACYGNLLGRDPTGQADLTPATGDRARDPTGLDPPTTTAGRAAAQAGAAELPDELLFVASSSIDTLAAATELPDVLFWARAAFSTAAVVCEALTDLRPIDYLEALTSARDAAAEAAELLDRAPSAPPSPPPVSPSQPRPSRRGRGRFLRLPPTPGSQAARELAARAQRVTDAVTELAAAITACLLRGTAQATNPADRRALEAATVRAAALADGVGADPIRGW